MSQTTSLPSVSVVLSGVPRVRGKIWIDLDNSPHVPFFRPIINELKERNLTVFVTARDAYQVRELLDYYGVSAQIIGKHYGRHKVLKGLGTIWRAVSLLSLIRNEKPDLAVSHGSRACLLACAFLKIPNMLLADYEFTAKVPTIKPTWLMTPDVVPDGPATTGSRILKYPGIKEDVYLPQFRPDRTLRARLGISENTILVTVRPPATEAHYHNPESEALLNAALARFVLDPAAKILLLPRNKRQAAELRKTWHDAITSNKILIPDHVEDGLNVIWNSDLVISGGGTMNREAAGMGVPVYSIFRGKIGAVDRYLADQKRLVLLETVEQVNTQIKAEARNPAVQSFKSNRAPALARIIEHIESALPVHA